MKTFLLSGASLTLRQQLLLLGQAESGKSTLQKQFQLMYKPNSLELERASWKTVIYFNVVHSLKHILNTLDSLEDFEPDDSIMEESVPRSKLSPLLDQPSPSTSLVESSSLADHSNALTQSNTISTNHHNSPPLKDVGMVSLAQLRRRLSPLVGMDSQLADRLSGGISVSGSGKGGVYVRSGWQARTIENALGKIKSRRTSMDVDKKARERASQEIIIDPLVKDVGSILQVCESDITALWYHPTVKEMMAKRKLKLDEWSELCVAFS